MAFTLHAWVGWIGPFLLLPGLVALAADRWLSRTGAIAAACVSLGILFVPISHIPLHAWIHAVTGDLSITTIVLLVAGLIYSTTGRAAIAAPDARFMLSLAGVVGLFFYPLALGLSAFDPYQLGYDSKLFVWVLLAGAFALWFAKMRSAAIVIALGVLAWTYSLMESSNLWDALIDPLLVVSSWGYWAGRSLRRR